MDDLYLTTLHSAHMNTHTYTHKHTHTLLRHTYAYTHRASLSKEGILMDNLYLTTLYGGPFVGQNQIIDSPTTVQGLLFLRCVFVCVQACVCFSLCIESIVCL